jgi:hypothetical protein
MLADSRLLRMKYVSLFDEKAVIEHRYPSKAFKLKVRA